MKTLLPLRIRPVNSADRFAKINARRDSLIVRCLTSPKATQADRLSVQALAHPLLRRIQGR